MQHSALDKELYETDLAMAKEDAINKYVKGGREGDIREIYKDILRERNLENGQMVHEEEKRKRRIAKENEYKKKYSQLPREKLAEEIRRLRQKIRSWEQ